MDENNGALVHKINNAKVSDKFIFIRLGERKAAMKRITDIILREKDELWVLDSYFTDKGSGLQQMTDWLRPIVNFAMVRFSIYHKDKQCYDICKGIMMVMDFGK